MLTRGIGFTDIALCDMMNLSLERWLKSKVSLISQGFISMTEENVIRLLGWPRFRPEDIFPVSKKGDKDHGERRYLADIRTEVISHLNSKRSYPIKPSSRAAVENIEGRIKEGANMADFIRVIDLKAKQWSGTRNEQYLHPSYLFNLDNFWTYVNEKPGAEGSPEMKSFCINKKELATLPYIQAEYHARLEAKKKRMGWNSFADIDWKKVPTEVEFVKNRLREIRSLKEGEDDTSKDGMEDSRRGRRTAG
jgi:uncharacterized phage protein (TIGR02220 family)